MRTLLEKETSGLRAFWVATMALALWFALSHLLDDLPRRPPSELLLEGMEDWTFFCGLFAFALGHGLVAPEYRDDHIEFLDGLPVHRGAVYVAKVLAALPLVAVLVLTTGATKLAVYHVDAPHHAADPTGALLLLVALYAASLVGTLGLGFAASWLGGLGWGLFGLTMVGLLIASIEVAALRPYMPFDGVFALGWEGARPVQIRGPLLVWPAVGCVGILGSGLLFLGPGRVLVATGSQVLGGLRLVAVGCGSAMFLALTALIGVGMVVQFGHRILEPTRIVRTPHFRVLYRVAEEEAALALVEEAEALAEATGALVGNPEPFPLDIELLGAARYHAGVFLGGKIRMGLDEGRRTLAHELAHAHAYAISGWAAHEQFDHVRFFEEGLAEYVDDRVVPRNGSDLAAAAIWKTGQARFDVLVEDDERGKRHDPTQVYPLGRQFVEAVVDELGPTGPACLLRALRDIGAEPVAGITLWYRLVDACDGDLGAVVARYDARLAALAEDLPDPLPVLTAGVVAADGGLSLVVHDRHALGWKLTCRFRDREDTELRQFQHRPVVEGRCAVPGGLSGRSMGYQLGFELPDGSSVFSRWTLAPLQP